MLKGTQINLDQLLRLRYYAQGIDLSRCKRVTAKHSGLDISGFRGRGMDFDEVRVYQSGDEIRNMDWRVTARTGVAHTKLYKEERERPVYVVVDYSASMQFGTQVAFKSVIAAEAATLVAWAAANHGDRVGALVFNGKTQIESKPAPRERGVMPILKILANLQEQQEAQPGGLAKALATLRHSIRPGSIIFIFSDFNSLDEEAKHYLAQMAPRNEIVAHYIYDALEANLPPPARYGFSDGSVITNINTHVDVLRERFAAQYQTRVDLIRKTLHQRRIPMLELATHHAVAQVLQRRLSHNQRMQWK